MSLWLIAWTSCNGASYGWAAEQAGVRVEYQVPAAAAVVRIEPTIGFSAHAEVPTPTGLQVTWHAELEPPAAGEYRLACEVRGQLEARLAGDVIVSAAQPTRAVVVGRPLQLSGDPQSLDVRFVAMDDDAHLALYWSGPGFEFEPIPAKYLTHSPVADDSTRWARGEDLYRELRCAACHATSAERAVVPAPALDQLSGNLRRSWLSAWLTAAPATEPDVTRRMPHFKLAAADAVALAAYLLGDSAEPVVEPGPAPSGGTADAQAGRQLFVTLGCLACHRWDTLGGEPSASGGGDLQRISDKRPADFFARWLADPASVNRDHQMPRFDLSDVERRQLAAFLSTGDAAAVDDAAAVGDAAAGDKERSVPADAAVRQTGERLFHDYGCDACHRGPNQSVTDAAQPPSRRESAPSLNAASHWERACVTTVVETGPVASTTQPRYVLTEFDALAVRDYIGLPTATRQFASELATGPQAIVARKCLGCHERDGIGGLLDRWDGLSHFAPLAAAELDLLRPPSLNSVGDKLPSLRLQAVIRQQATTLRPWLRVRMPLFRLSDQELAAISDWLVNRDRIPSPLATELASPIDPLAAKLAGARLVTANGFGCLSCHAIGSQIPKPAAPGTRGPSLDALGQRLRPTWFRRFVMNPLRIAPRLEMPSIQQPVKGVLDDTLESQLAALWQALNVPDFEPPRANPIRVLRQAGAKAGRGLATVICDGIQTERQRFSKPFVIGLANRQTVIYDLAQARLGAWRLGDVASQHTEGKSWLWQAAGEPLWEASDSESEWLGLSLDRELRPQASGQFLTEVDQWRHVPDGIEFSLRLQFSPDSSLTRSVEVRQRISTWTHEEGNGFRREIEIRDLPADARLRLQVVPRNLTQWRWRVPGRSVAWTEPTAGVIELRTPEHAMLDAEGAYTFSAASAADAARVRRIELIYQSEIGTDGRLEVTNTPPVEQQQRLSGVPGFTVERLPLSSELMPTALSWDPARRLYVASLKGDVIRVSDLDGDGAEETLQQFSDELAAPYGLCAQHDYVDVLTKSALLRLYDEDDDGRADRTQTVASGWGHTDDYHDWAVGLPRDPAGRYYLALPCQQDQRSAAAARYRGRVLRLTPRAATVDNPRLFALEEFASGQRFPMGLALRADGELFGTDNQGNYNPFNELNHLRAGRHYGFINALERGDTLPREISAPAINLPHPWTRSVNGICFLTNPDHAEPQVVGPQVGSSATFGPLAGHLIGCEYDTRRLIRMTLQRVDGEWQGAAYPMSRDARPGESTMMGPVCCAVSPDGRLYIGSLRDSGWGGANDVGEVVRMTCELDQLPCGIRELRATAGGFTLEFIRPVARELAADRSKYRISSYYRVSTPAYGGDDRDRRAEAIRSVSVSDDGLRVQLEIENLAAGRVYEVRLESLAPDAAEFFPAEAFYSLSRIPRE